MHEISRHFMRFVSIIGSREDTDLIHSVFFLIQITYSLFMMLFCQHKAVRFTDNTFPILYSIIIRNPSLLNWLNILAELFYYKNRPQLFSEATQHNVHPYFVSYTMRTNITEWLSLKLKEMSRMTLQWITLEWLYS